MRVKAAPAPFPILAVAATRSAAAIDSLEPEQEHMMISPTLTSIRAAAGACALAAVLAAAPAAAQQPGPGPEGGPGWRGMMGPGMMMGPDMMMGYGRRGRGWGMCDPRMMGFGPWRIERMEQALALTEAQKGAFEELKTASEKAREQMQAACPTEWPQTPTGRLEMMEQRMEAMLQAIRTVRPALDKFYASLTDEQKARINSGGRGWRWRDRS
ncbi:MAG: Spy/CpxP family protein refolding chaperone [Xanthobacteraceae bacterium]|nr:Spy/CpxP family protein refolding chaperone [Xanthobacteraceae bacterium]